MFGLKKRQEDLDNMLMLLSTIRTSVENHKEDIHKQTKYADSHFKHFANDFIKMSSEMSIIRSRINEMDAKLSKIPVSVEKIDPDKHLKEVNFCSLMQSVESKLDKIFEIADSQEDLIGKMQHILDDHMPIRKVPKLPKKQKATIAVS